MTDRRRARADERAQRVNAAAELLATGSPVAEAARELARRLGLSERQARRYVDRARTGGQVEVPGAKVVFTVKLPATLARRVRRAARAGRRSRRWSPRRSPSSWTASTQGPAMAVADRPVELECVFDRLGPALLTQAYRLMVPECREPGQQSTRSRSRRDDTDADRGHLRQGVLRPPDQGADDPKPDRGAAGPRRAAGT